jgi:hypothetical protein
MVTAMPIEYSPGILRRVGRAISGAAGERPRRLEEVEEYLQPGANPIIARHLARLPETGKLPARGTPGRARYQRELRTVQRYRKTPGEGQRRHTAAGERRILRAVTRAFPFDPTAELRQVGASMVIKARIRVSEEWTEPIMPISGAVTIGAAELGPALGAWQGGDMEEAGFELMEAFWMAYWHDPEPIREMSHLFWISFTAGQS